MYGFYKIPSDEWSAYSLTDSFQFHKKQLFVVESDISDLELEYNNGFLK